MVDVLRSAICNAAAGPAASMTTYPAFFSTFAVSVRTVSSSSTTRIVSVP